MFGEPGWQGRSPTDRYVGLEFKGEVCGNDTDLEFVMLVEAVSVIVDTDTNISGIPFAFSIFWPASSSQLPYGFVSGGLNLWRAALRYCSWFVCRLVISVPMGRPSPVTKWYRSPKAHLSCFQLGQTMRYNLPFKTWPQVAPLLGLFIFSVLLPLCLTSLPREHFFNESLAHKFSSQGLFLKMCTWDMMWIRPPK